MMIKFLSILFFNWWSKIDYRYSPPDLHKIDRLLSRVPVFC